MLFGIHVELYSVLWVSMGVSMGVCRSMSHTRDPSVVVQVLVMVNYTNSNLITVE